MSGCVVRTVDGSDFNFPNVTLDEFVEIWRREMPHGILHMRGQVALNLSQIVAVQAK